MDDLCLLDTTASLPATLCLGFQHHSRSGAGAMAIVQTLPAMYPEISSPGLATLLPTVRKRMELFFL